MDLYIKHYGILIKPLPPSRHEVPLISCKYQFADTRFQDDVNTFDHDQSLHSAYKKWHLVKLVVKDWPMDFVDKVIPDDLTERGRRLARYLLLNKPWEVKDGVTIKARGCRNLAFEDTFDIPPPEESNSETKTSDRVYISQEDA